jgi:AcrR family transcriptional regulator
MATAVAEATRTAALATAALRLFLDRGVEAVTIDEIASRAGLAKGTFYTYFRDKADVVEALLAPVTTKVRGAFDRCESALRAVEDPAALPGAYLALADALATALAEHQGVALLYLQESRMPAVGARAPVALFAREVRERAVVLTHAARTHGLLRALLRRGLAEEPEFRQLLEPGHRGVGLNSVREHQALDVPVLRNQCDASGDGGVGVLPTDRLALEQHLAADGLPQAEHSLEDLGPTAADHSCQPQDLAGSHPQVDSLEALVVHGLELDDGSASD